MPQGRRSAIFGTRNGCNLYSRTKGQKPMLLHWLRAAAAERSGAFDVMLSDLEVNWLFNDGAISIERVVR
jgi:hypothetical protein